MEGSGGSAHGSPESEQIVMFGEAIATPIQDTSLSSLTETSHSSMVQSNQGNPTARTGVEYQQPTIGHIDARQIVFESNQSSHFTDARSVNLLDLNPLVVAQAHQVVSEVQGQAIQYASEVEANARNQTAQYVQAMESQFRNQALQQIQGIESNAQAQIQSQVQSIENQARSQIQAVESTARSMVQQSQEEAHELVRQTQGQATRLMNQSHQEVANYQNQIEQLKALVIDRTNQVVEVTGALNQREKALESTTRQMNEMRGQMEAMMRRIKDQDERLQSLAKSGTPGDPSTIHPCSPPPKATSFVDRNPKGVGQPSPSMKVHGMGELVPVVHSIATPKSYHPGTVAFQGQPMQDSRVALPSFALTPIATGTNGEELHLAPSPTQSACAGEIPKANPMLPPAALLNDQIGLQIQSDQNTALQMQVHQLTIQMQQLIGGLTANPVQSGNQPSSNRSRDRRKVPGSPPGSGSSSSSSDSKGKGSNRNPGGGGDSPPKSPSGDGSSSDSEDPYKREKRLMRIKQYDYLKIPALPQDAAKCRSFRNAVFSGVCKFAKNDESIVFRWINRCNISEDGKEFNNAKDFPILDRILGAKLLEAAKGTKFALEFQTHQERCQTHDQQPKGRKLLWLIFQKFRLDRDRGTALSQHHLLSLKMNGSDIKALEDFRQRYDFCVGALEPSEMPAETSLRSLLFESLKNHPKMALAIDKFREANTGSYKRTSRWLYSKMCEAIEISQMDLNTTSMDKALTSAGLDPKVGGAQAEAKDKKKKDEKTKKEKEKKPEQDTKVKKEDKPKTSKKVEEDKNVDAAFAQKGKGKGKDGKGKNKEDKPPLTKEQKAKLPCMYFAYDSCTRGKDCEFLHDKGNLYKGPKPRLKSGTGASSSSHAGAASVAAATAFASIPSAEAALKEAKKVCRKVTRSSLRVPCVQLLAKAVTTIMTAITCCNPMSQIDHSSVPALASHPCQMEFLMDSGAGRNLLSKDSMPDDWRGFIIDPPENLIFRTGGGERKTTKAIELQGQVSGLNTFYTLDSCPHALSLGIQVNHHKRGFVWLPDELPYMIKADRLGDLKHFCPESAKIHMEVRENVPIIHEWVGAAPADLEASPGPVAFDSDTEPIGGPSSGSRDRPAGAPVPEPEPRVEAPVDLPKVSDKVLKEKPETLPHFGDELMLCDEPKAEPLDAPLDEEDEEANPWTPSLRERLEEEAKSETHQLCHFPKNRYCSICQRAKMTGRVHRSRGAPGEDEIPPLHYGHMMRADHIILGADLTKGAGGEQACLVCFDEFSGCIGAYSMTSRDTDSNILCLQKFAGTRASPRSSCLVKTDCAQELTKAVEHLGWLSEPGIENDPYHNAKLESLIRRIKEGTRAIHLKSGLPHAFWPRSIEYFVVAHAITHPCPVHPNETPESKALKAEGREDLL